MSLQSKRDYVEAVLQRYKHATRTQKGIILDEFCVTLDLHRKHAIRVLRGYKRFTKPKPKKRGPKPVYNDKSIIGVLKRIWLAANLPCSKRLKAILPLWIPGYQSFFALLPAPVTQRLLQISPATIDRLLKPVRIRYTRRGRSTTKPGTLIRNQIPVGVNQWDQTSPGFLEADTVAHCGESMAGQFVYTLDCVDIATGWSEQCAVWGRGEAGILEQLRKIEDALPFPILGFDCDNGSEFLNYHLLRHFSDRKKPVQFTRSRSYHKEDNAHIEQKNWTHVRQWIGYGRLDKASLVPLLNDLYRNEWRLFQNFFCPSAKLLAKEQVGSKTIKRHDSPKTPFQRIIDSTQIPQTTKEQLISRFLTLNPFVLRKAMETKLKKLFSSCYKQTPYGQRSSQLLR